MKLLVTGSEGYIGSVLVSYLRDRGHAVTGLDTGFYVDGCLYKYKNGVRQIGKDIRNVTAEDVAGFDAVVHLAELSNDPLGQHNEENTFDINHAGSVNLARACKDAGVGRFVYTSSCSVYGIQNGEPLKSETSTLIPQTAYARCKVLVERDVSALADDAFSPVFLRNATAYGASPRMRFDIVLNNLAGFAWTTNEIRMTSDGSPWRPLVHILDISRAIACALEAPKESIHNEIFNVGDTNENYKIRDVAIIVAETFKGCRLSMGSSDGDNRSYRVSFEKIRRLPGFECSWTVATGARQLHDLFESISMDRDTFEFRAFTRLKQLEYLIRTERIDNRFFWN